MKSAIKGMETPCSVFAQNVGFFITFLLLKNGSFFLENIRPLVVLGAHQFALRKRFDKG